MGFAEYDDYDGLGLAALVRSKHITALELVEEAIERIERRDPALNAVVHRQFDRARREARDPRAGTGARFAGVPLLLKDLLGEQQGEPSTLSCRLLVDWRAPADSELVARYRRAGLIVVGRTNTPELGIYAVTEPELRGPTRNPWDLTRTPGGSSGGSAAAVAARMVPMAHGNDGGGSIRIPSAHCGLVGLKPTRARTPIGPTIGESWGGMVVEHVITRSVRDTAAMLDVAHGPEDGAPYQVLPPARPFLDEVGAPPGKLRIAFTKRTLFPGQMHADCIHAIERTALICRELGHEVEEEEPLFDKELLARVYLVKVAAGVAAAVRAAAERAGRAPRPADCEAATWLLKVIGEHVSAADYVHYTDAAHRAARSIAAFFRRYDVLLTSTAATPPVPLGTFALRWSERLQIEVLQRAPLRTLLLLTLDKLAAGALAATPNTMLWNLTGQPAISLPLSWNEAGLPIGVQFAGRYGDEATLLRLSSQLEQARPWANRKPPSLLDPR